jgi:two-component system response regulator ChvI
MALAQVGGAGRGGRVIVTLDDRLLRESLAMALAEEGFWVLEFASADAALTHIEAGAGVDALIVDDQGDAGMAGDDENPRARLRAARCASPVYVLSAHGDARCDAHSDAQGDARAAADKWGAVGIIDRTQPFASLRRNLTNAIRAGALLAEPGALGSARSQGPLVSSAEGTGVSWKGNYLELGPAEQALLFGLVGAPETGLTYQRAQTILSALDERRTEGGFGGGPGGSPERVKSLVRRLRKKFREVDPEFDQIVFVPGCGYGWRGSEAPMSKIVR